MRILSVRVREFGQVAVTTVCKYRFVCKHSCASVSVHTHAYFINIYIYTYILYIYIIYIYIYMKMVCKVQFYVEFGTDKK